MQRLTDPKRDAQIECQHSIVQPHSEEQLAGGGVIIGATVLQTIVATRTPAVEPA